MTILDLNNLPIWISHNLNHVWSGTSVPAADPAKSGRATAISVTGPCCREDGVQPLSSPGKLMPWIFNDALVCVLAQRAYYPETSVFWEIMKQCQERQRPCFLSSARSLKRPGLWESLISCDLQHFFLCATKECAFHVQGKFQTALWSCSTYPAFWALPTVKKNVSSWIVEQSMLAEECKRQR